MTAEIAIIVRDSGTSTGYEDGDFLDVFTNRRKRCVHAAGITHIKLAGFNSDGLRDTGTVFEDWQNITYQYKFTRINRTEVERFDGTTTDRFGLPDIDVPLYLQRRKQHARHRIFGTTGSEIWYGGRKDFSDAALDVVWAAIELKTDQREVNFPLWPAGRQDLRSFLFIKINDIDESAAHDLVAPLMDVSDLENPIVLKKRKSFATWRVFDVAPEGDILDRDTTIDVRDRVSVNHNLFTQLKT